MKIKEGTKVSHKHNPRWQGVVTRDLDPRCPVNGFVLVIHNGREGKLPKSLLKKVNG